MKKEYAKLDKLISARGFEDPAVILFGFIIESGDFTELELEEMLSTFLQLPADAFDE